MKNKVFYKKFHSGLEIIGPSRAQVSKTKEAIKLVENTDNVCAKYVKLLKGILIHPERNYTNEFFKSFNYWVCQSGTVLEAELSYLASLIVHEAYHADQAKRGVMNIDSRGEPPAYKKQIEFLKKVKDFRGAEYVKKLLKEKHWTNDPSLEYKNGRLKSSTKLINFLSDYRKGKLKVVDI